MTDKQILDKYLKVPYLLHGRTLAGSDCWGTVILVYKDLGYKLLDIEEDYNEHWSWKGRNLFIENYYSKWEKVAKPNRLDVVLFKNSKGIACHGGIILRNERFIHTSKKIGTSLIRLYDKKIDHKIEGFYHYKDLKND